MLPRPWQRTQEIHACAVYCVLSDAVLVSGAIIDARAAFATPMQQTSPTASSAAASGTRRRSEEHTSELQSQSNLVCRLLLEKKKKANWAARRTGSSLNTMT